MDKKTKTILAVVIVAITVVGVSLFIVFQGQEEKEDESIVGTWQTADGTDTVIFYANGVFGGSYTGPNPVSYSGTYTIQGNTLTITYITPPPQNTLQLTFTISGDTLILYNPQTGVSMSYTKISSAIADDATPGFELIFAVCAIALVLFWKRKR